MVDTNDNEKCNKKLAAVLLLMLGSMVISGYIIAPLLFYYAATPTIAGNIAGIVFQISNGVVLLLGLAAIEGFLQEEAYKKKIWLPLLLLIDLVALNSFVFAPIIADIKAAAGSIELLPLDDVQRQAFGMWHGITAVLHLVITACCAWLVYDYFASSRR